MTSSVKLLFIFSLVFFFLFSANGQSTITGNANAQATSAKYLGKTSAVRDLLPLGVSPKEKKQQWKKEHKIPRNFVGRGENKIVRPDLEHQGKDTLRQGILAGTKSTDASLLVNINGQTNGSPNDPTGDVGKNHYLHAINATLIGVYDKQGTELMTFSANTLWQEIGFSSAGDPIIMYDQIADRWIITEFPNGSQLLVAISENSDPTGAYDVYNFQTPTFPDYPKYGIWRDAITVTTNEQGAGNLTIYVINKDELYGAKDEVAIQRLNLPGNNNTEAGFFVATPVDWMGKNAPVSNDPIFLALDDSSWGSAEADQVNLFTVDIDWGNPSNTTWSLQSIVTSPFDGNPCSVPGFGFSCVPQPSSNVGLDAIPEVIMNQAVYRNFGDYEVLVFNFITDVTDGNNLSGIRWMELRKSIGAWEIYQEGTFSPDDGLDRYMGGIAIDASGNIGLAYNVSSEDEFVGVRYTGRKHDDELGIMTVPEQIVVEGENTIQSGTRFGDYAQMGVDPVNGKTFWYTTEYAAGGGTSSQTRIIAFELDRDNVDIGVHKLISPFTSGFDGEQNFTVQINNYGLTEITEFQVGYIFEGGTPFVETITETIAPGNSIEHTFSQAELLPVGGLYELTSFTSLTADELIVNDTMHTTLKKIVARDVGINSIMFPAIGCDDVIPGTTTITNFGIDTISTFEYTITINGEEIISDTWNGTLAFCETTVITYDLIDLIDGENIIEVTTSLPNEMADQNMANNTSQRTINYILNAVRVNLQITTDNFAEETSWTLADEDGNVLYEGGNYQTNNTTFNTEFCLVDNSCYTFTLNDSYGDGISSGNYVITNSNNLVLANLMNSNFGFQEVNDFCADASCLLDVEATTTASTDNDGIILLTPTNGVGPFTYSIDGGDTFQDVGLFENLGSGDYVIVVQGAGNCLYEGFTTILQCTLQSIVDATDATENELGQITITAEGGTEPYEYSINGGATFQSNPTFLDLSENTYNVIVRDSIGCEVSIEVEIKMVIATHSTEYGYILTATPNPTPGDFHIYLKGSEITDLYIPLEIYNAQGQLIRHSTMVRYDNNHVAHISLHHEEAGIYFIKVKNEQIKRMVKVIKI